MRPSHTNKMTSDQTQIGPLGFVRSNRFPDPVKLGLIRSLRDLNLEKSPEGIAHRKKPVKGKLKMDTGTHTSPKVISSKKYQQRAILKK